MGGVKVAFDDWPTPQSSCSTSPVAFKGLH